MQDESVDYIKKIWAEHFKMEVSHLKTAAKLLKKYENKTFESICGTGEFPQLLKLGGNKEYIRKVLAETINLTADNTVKVDGYKEVKKLPDEHRYFDYQNFMSGDPDRNPSHLVIQKAIERLGQDYRYQDKEHPVKELRNRKSDNVYVARTK